MYKKSLIHYISKIIIDVLFYASIVFVIFVPFTAKYVFYWINYPYKDYMLPFTIIIFLSGICCTYILYNLKKMYASLLVGNPFVNENVCHFRKMAVACMSIAVIYIIKCIFLFTLAAVIIAVCFIIGCLFCLTLKDLFKQAINYKAENDLTI